MDELPPLPPGFTLEPAGDSLPPLPPGFTLEQPAPPPGPHAAAQADPLNPDASFQDLPQRPPVTGKPYTGKLVPFSRDESGKVGFDPRAGVTGPYGGLAIAAHNAYEGKPVDMGDVLKGALAINPAPPAGLTTTARAATPSTPTLREAGERGLQAYRDSNQLYNKAEYEALLNNIRHDLRERGLNDTTGSASHAHRVLDHELERVAERPIVTSGDVDRLRVALGNAPKNELAGGMQAREHVMSFIESNNPGEGGRAVRDAVGNYRQSMRSEFIEDTLEKQADKATARNARPTAEQTRGKIADILHHKQTENWPAADTVGLNEALRSTRAQRLAQNVGAAMPRVSELGQGSIIYGGGTGATLAAAGVPPTVAGAVGAGVTAAGVGAGYAARGFANRGARVAGEEASAAVRRNSPLFISQPRDMLSYAPKSDDARAAATRALIGRQLPATPQQPAWQQQPGGGFVRQLPDGTLEELS